MKNNIKEAEKQNRELITRLISQGMTADEFCSAYTEYWVHIRNEQEKIKKAWTEPFDQKLVEARLRGEVEADEFARRYSELWGIEEVASFYEMVNSIHSACSCYNASPQYDWEIGEDQLKTEVRDILAKYECSNRSG